APRALAATALPRVTAGVIVVDMPARTVRVISPADRAPAALRGKHLRDFFRGQPVPAQVNRPRVRRVLLALDLPTLSLVRSVARTAVRSGRAAELFPGLLLMAP